MGISCAKQYWALYKSRDRDRPIERKELILNEQLIMDEGNRPGSIHIYVFFISILDIQTGGKTPYKKLNKMSPARLILRVFLTYSLYCSRKMHKKSEKALASKCSIEC